MIEENKELDTDAIDYIERLEKENKRFRDALEEIAEYAGDYYTNEVAQITLSALVETV